MIFRTSVITCGVSINLQKEGLKCGLVRDASLKKRTIGNSKKKENMIVGLVINDFF